MLDFIAALYRRQNKVWLSKSQLLFPADFNLTVTAGNFGTKLAHQL